MKLAYLLNSYPMTSTTFIRREIRAIEAQGVPVTRFAVRHWDGTLVDPEDIAEQQATEYLLTGGIARLFGALFVELFTNLPRLLAALPRWTALLRAGGGFVRHFAYLLQAIRFRQRAAALGITHVHVHFSTNAAAVAMLAGRLGGPGYSFTVHGPDELVDPAANLMGAKVADARFVVAITNYCRGRILEHAAPADAAKVVVIACGIRIGDYPFTVPAQWGERLVCVGRLCANKAQALIPAAVAAVREEFPGLVVELIGGGEDEALVRAEIAKHDVAAMFDLTGWAANEVVTRHVQQSRALLLPSFAEGLPIVIMEALALGRPVLTTRIAGIPELVDDRVGWIVPPGDHDALVAAIRAALRAGPDELAGKGAEGRARIEARHDVDASAAALIAAFRG